MSKHSDSPYCKCDECQELFSNWAIKFAPTPNNPFLKVLKESEKKEVKDES